MPGISGRGAAVWLCAAVLALAPVAAAALNPDGGWRRQWPVTDFDRAAVDLSEVRAGGPGRDGIPALDRPAMIPVAAKDLPGPEPVMSLDLPGETPRAWPVRYLMWHEIVNDVIGGRAVSVTFCPLCNSGLVFEGAQPDGRVLDFGVTGMLRKSDMVMYDRQTESWWQQFTGEAIFGEMVGATLTALPSLLESWDDFRARAPDGLVMAEPADHVRPWGDNPYRGYDTLPGPFLYRGELPPRGIDPMERVVRIGDRAWPMARIAEAGGLEEAGYRFEWRPGQASALDASRIAEGREVGGVRVTEAATGAPVVAEVVFAFVFTAFEPAGTWMTGD